MFLIGLVFVEEEAATFAFDPRWYVSQYLNLCASRRHAHPSRSLWCGWACLPACFCRHASVCRESRQWRHRPWSTLIALARRQPHCAARLASSDMSRPVWAGAGDGGAHGRLSSYSRRQAQLLFQGIKAPGLKSNQSQVETARRLAADHASLRPEIESRRAPSNSRISSRRAPTNLVRGTRLVRHESFLVFFSISCCLPSTVSKVSAHVRGRECRTRDRAGSGQCVIARMSGLCGRGPKKPTVMPQWGFSRDASGPLSWLVQRSVW